MYIGLTHMYIYIYRVNPGPWRAHPVLSHFLSFCGYVVSQVGVFPLGHHQRWWWPSGKTPNWLSTKQWSSSGGTTGCRPPTPRTTTRASVRPLWDSNWCTSKPSRAGSPLGHHQRWWWLLHRVQDKAAEDKSRYEAELVTFNAEHGDTFAQKKAKEKKWVYTYTNIYYIGILIYI